jgi:hypothetical protein
MRLPFMVQGKTTIIGSNLKVRTIDIYGFARDAKRYSLDSKSLHLWLCKLRLLGIIFMCLLINEAPDKANNL